MPAPKKPAVTTAAKPVAKKPAPAKKPATPKKPAASIKAPAVKKPAVAKKAPTVPVAAKPAPAKTRAPKLTPGKKPVGDVPATPLGKAVAGDKPTAGKATAKPTAAKKPVAKVGAADGIKKTAIPAKVTETKKPAVKAAIKAGVKPAVEVKAAVAKALPAGFSKTAESLAVTPLTLSNEPSQHTVMAQTNPLGSDYTIAFFAPKGGLSVAVRQLHVTATQKTKKRLPVEETVTSVLKAVLSYENKRSQNKAFRGYETLSAVVTRNSTSVTQPMSFLIPLNVLQAMSF